MEARGRKSTQRRETVVAFPGVKRKTALSANSLQPPSFLTKSQVDTWREIVASKPVDWFGPENTMLLVGYCRAATSLNHLAAMVEKFERRKRLDSDGMRAYSVALAACEKQMKLVISLATKMRLTQQSKYRADKASAADRNGPKATRKPWEFE